MGQNNMKKFASITLAVIGMMYGIATAEVSEPISGRLDNGLDYTIVPLHDEVGRLEIRLRVDAGAVDEENHQNGVAHMVEHLVFRASDEYPNGVMNHLHDTGWVRARHYNAVTTADSTTYMLTPPAGKTLDETLAVLVQMMFYARLDKADLDNERQVVLEEWRGGQGVSARMDEQRKAVVRADSRYIRSPVIGTANSINTMPVDELQDFYTTWYLPNNMNLVIVGDVNVQAASDSIARHFGTAAQGALPVRDYTEPTLSDALRIAKLQDSQSGVSQVAYIVRFDERASRGDDDKARRERLIDRFALTFITKRLQNENANKDGLPTGVNSVVVRKSDIGKHTSALGVFAGVDKDGHRAGMQAVLEQIERLKHYPITEAEFASYKADLQAQLDRAAAHDSDRDFAGWVQAMATTRLVDKPYLPQPEIAKLTQPILDTLTVQDVQRRVETWLGATDRIVQYQPPYDTVIEPISEQDVLTQQAYAQNSTPTPPYTPPVLEPMTLVPIASTGSITDERYYPQEQVYEYQLSNGDRVLWLKHKVAGDRTYLRAVNGAGVQANELNVWQSQIATQLINQNAPLDFEMAQLTAYKKDNAINLSVKQTPSELIFAGSSKADSTQQLFTLYQAMLGRTAIKHGLSEVKQAMMNELHQRDTSHAKQRQHALAKLRANGEDGAMPIPAMPSADELQALTVADLHAEWHKMSQGRTTYYLLSDIDESQMKSMLTMLASIDRHGDGVGEFTHPKPTTTKAVRTVRFASNIEPKDDVQLWSNTAHEWRGQDAMLIAALKYIANDKLKLTLRDEKLGVYRVQFDSMLNPDTNQVESHLKFTTSPNKSAELIETAKQVLQTLPQNISERDVANMKAQFAKQETSRLESADTWLNRLMLSDKHYHDPRYLSDMQTMVETITTDQVRQMAAKLYNSEDVSVFIDTPLPSVVSDK